MTDFASAKYEIGKLVAEVESLRAQLAGWERMWTVLPEQHGDAVEQVRAIVADSAQLRLDLLRIGQMIEDGDRTAYDLVAKVRVQLGMEPPPDLDLLAKLASGEGGRRTGDLMRRGFITVEITEAGRKALEEKR